MNEGSEEEEGRGDRGEGKRVVEKDNLWEDLVEREREDREGQRGNVIRGKI